MKLLILITLFTSNLYAQTNFSAKLIEVRITGQQTTAASIKVPIKLSTGQSIEAEVRGMVSGFLGLVVDTEVIAIKSQYDDKAVKDYLKREYCNQTYSTPEMVRFDGGIKAMHLPGKYFNLDKKTIIAKFDIYKKDILEHKGSRAYIDCI